jgi:hexosaminidase
VELKEGSFRITIARGGGPMLEAAVERYNKQLFAPVSSTAEASAPLAASSSSAGGLRVEVRDPEALASVLATEQDESYTLEVDTGAKGVLRSNTTIGAMRGLETFAQLVEYSEDGAVHLWELPLEVRDAPRWRYRGLKVDTSRHFIPLQRLRNIIRGMEAAKLNVLQWHATDGPSFPLESKKYPELAAHGAFCRSCVYTQQDVRELVAFARARGVRIIAELDLPGHSGFQYGMPEIVACPAYEAGNGGARALDPTLDLTYSFLTEWLSEMAELFDDPLLNVYGDEVRFQCWNQSASVLAYMASHGIRQGDFQSVTKLFWQRFAREVAPAVFNRTGVAMMIGEADVFGTDGPPFALPQWLRAASPDYPLPLTVEVWGGQTLARNENGTLRKVLSTDGMQAVIGGAYYLDQTIPRPGTPQALAYQPPYFVSSWRTMYGFEPLGDPSLTPEQRARVIGLVGEMWGEQINGASVEQRIFPRVLAVSERAWTAQRHFDNSTGPYDNEFYAKVEGRLNKMACTLNRRGVESTVSAPGHCSWSQTD